MQIKRCGAAGDRMLFYVPEKSQGRKKERKLVHVLLFLELRHGMDSDQLSTSSGDTARVLIRHLLHLLFLQRRRNMTFRQCKVKVKLSHYRPGQALGSSWRLRLQNF